ncbi:MAG: penicillin-binding protein 2 [Candidatus Colwellbacteria bacterium RIFCSPHIGHO2_12_FULL_44_17]|uniref:Penicillin-binding protein 2 n=2 Tax=Candidatus Colwelliibacteriota TaxID=1817904 RepID=A0A1G1ZB81_9BACT|nr:MAG: penicillin-binding protein 2 [Candidatus Colwellbacteria bacterium RIFCSPHIGHO2_12_FULL_44_17]OGY60887.1 MAG: penicillin-binding protein 2 [Candidatus Colwellbacteria bacterium RIFCSPLOWO2_02_FULL_44_20b]
MKKVSHQNLEFEEAIADSFSEEEFTTIESPLPRRVFRLTVVAACLFAVVFFVRLATIGFSKGDFYKDRALANVNKEIYDIAPRGIVLDRYGKPLVENIPIFSVFIKTSELFREKEEEKVANTLYEVLDIEPGAFYALLRESNLEIINELLVAQDITLEEAIALRGMSLESLKVKDDYKRKYASPAFSHITGYVGLADKEDLKLNQNLQFKDIVGKTGLEDFYDDILRGQNGVTIMYRDAHGTMLEERKVEEAAIGEDIKTTIDGEFQEYLYRELSESLADLGRVAGVGLALDPKNGEVLAMVSLPSFDANVFTSTGTGEKRLELLTDERKPLFNRALGGAYNPGSTIKPFVAFGALNEKVITPEKEIFSAGYIEIPNPYNPDLPSRFVDWRAHGWVDVHSALARSSNVYFYEVGAGFESQKGLGIERLRRYWQVFGFGEKTGIDFPGEAKGFLPSPEEKEERTGSIWRIGDTYNVAIGQGDLLLSPLQLVRAVASLVNGGNLVKPKILMNTEESVKELLPESNDEEKILEDIKEGMEDAVEKSYGTAHLLATLPFSVGAKTGSAQISNNTKTNAFITAYTPAENPEIVLLILVEDAKEGSLNAVPIANRVLWWYYTHRMLN